MCCCSSLTHAAGARTCVCVDTRAQHTPARVSFPILFVPEHENFRPQGSAPRDVRCPSSPTEVKHAAHASPCMFSRLERDVVCVFWFISHRFCVCHASCVSCARLHGVVALPFAVQRELILDRGVSASRLCAFVAACANQVRVCISFLCIEKGSLVIMVILGAFEAGKPAVS